MNDQSISNRPDVSVCIVTWNGKDLTLVCLESLYRHTDGMEVEVILVDNGSDDGTAEAISTAFPLVRIIRNDKNEGFTLPNNQAIMASSGRYLMLLNNDTKLTENSLPKMVAYLDDHQDVGVLGCRLRRPDGTIQMSAHSDMTWWDYLFAALHLHVLFPRSTVFGRINMTYMDYQAETRDVDWIAGAAMLVRREAIRTAGTLDERIFAFSEDWEWCIRIKRSGWRVVYFCGTELIHLEGMSSHSNSSRKAEEVRVWSLLTAAASSYYVYEKLNAYSGVSYILFGFCRRLFFLSKSLTYALANVLTQARPAWGKSKGYLLAALYSPAYVRERYLRRTPMAK